MLVGTALRILPAAQAADLPAEADGEAVAALADGANGLLESVHASSCGSAAKWWSAECARLNKLYHRSKSMSREKFVRRSISKSSEKPSIERSSTSSKPSSSA